MSNSTLSPTVLTAHLEGEAVVLEMDHRRYFRLNETGQVAWRALEDGGGKAAAVTALVEAFNVDVATARAEIERFISDLSEAGLVRPPGS